MSGLGEAGKARCGKVISGPASHVTERQAGRGVESQGKERRGKAGRVYGEANGGMFWSGLFWFGRLGPARNG